MKKQIYLLVFTVIFILSGYAAVYFTQDIKDWWFLRSYNPSSEISALAENSGMNNKGRNIFYVGDPKLQNKEEFSDNCPLPERTIVLGCYSSQKIYLLDVTEEKLEGVEEVTAAHEMLHAAYERLDEGQKNEVNAMLQVQYKQITDERLLSLIDEYREQDPNSVNNELHSIIPTELINLTDDLEEYYSKYFSDRLKVVFLAKQYEDVFISSSKQIETLDNQINALKVEIELLEAELSEEQMIIDQKRQELDQLLDQEKIDEYNAAAKEFNQYIKDYNDKVFELESIVENHNSIVEKRNSKALEHNSLIKSLDSTYQEI